MSNTQSFQAPTESIPRRFRMLVNAIDECNLTTIHHHCKQIKALVIAGANTTVVEAEGALHHIDVRAVMRVGALLKVREDLHTELQASSNAWTYHSMAQRDRHNHVKRLFNETSQNITDVVNELIMTRQRRILGQNEEATKEAKLHIEQLVANLSGGYVKAARLDTFNIIACINRGADTNVLKKFSEERHLEWARLLPIMNWQRSTCDHLNRTAELRADTNFPTQRSIQLAAFESSERAERCSVLVDKAISELSAHFIKHQPEDEKTAQSSDAASDVRVLAALILDALRQRSHSALKHAFNTLRRKQLNAVDFLKVVEQLLEHGILHWMVLEMTDLLREHEAAIKNRDFVGKKIGTNPSNDPSFKEAIQEINRIEDGMHRLCINMFSQFNAIEQLKKESTVTSSDTQGQPSAAVDYTKVALQQLDQLMLNIEGEHRISILMDLSIIVDNLQKGADNKTIQARAEEMRLDWDTLTDIMTMQYQRSRYMEQIQADDSKCSTLRDHITEMARSLTQYLVDTANTHIEKAVEMLIKDYRLKKEETMQSENIVKLRRHVRDLVMNLKENDLKAARSVCGRVMSMIGIDTTVEQITAALKEHGLEFSMLDEIRKQNIIINVSMDTLQELGKYKVDTPALTKQANDNLTTATGKIYGILDQAANKLNQADRQQRELHREISAKLSALADNLKRNCRHLATLDIFSLMDTIRQGADVNFARTIAEQYGISYPLLEKIDSQLQIARDHSSKIAFMTGVPGHEHDANAVARIGHVRALLDSVTARIAEAVEALIHPHQPKKEESMKQETIATITAAPGHTLEQVSATQVDVKKEVQLTQVEIIIDASKAKPIELRTRFNRIVETAKMIRGALSGTAMNALIGDLDFIYSGIGPKWDLAEVVRVFGEKGIGENDVMAWVRAEGHHLFWTADGDKLNAKKYEICVVEMVQQFVDTIREKAGLRKLVVKWVHNDTKQDGADVAYRVERDMKASAYALNIYLEQGQNSLAVKSCVDIAQAILLYPGVEEFARGQLELYGVSLEKVVEVTEALAGSKDGDLAEAIKVLKTLKPVKKSTASWIAMMPTGMPVQGGFRPGEIYVVSAQHAAPMAPACVTWEQLEKMLHSKPSTFPPKKEEPVKSGEMIPELKIPGELSNLTWAYKSVLCQSGLFSSHSTNTATVALGLVHDGLTKKDWTREQVLQAFLKEGVPTSATCAWLNAEATYDLARPYVQLMESKGVGHPEAQSGMIRSIQEQKLSHDQAVKLFIGECVHAFHGKLKAQM